MHKHAAMTIYAHLTRIKLMTRLLGHTLNITLSSIQLKPYGKTAYQNIRKSCILIQNGYETYLALMAFILIQYNKLTFFKIKIRYDNSTRIRFRWINSLSFLN